jgi:hypothetical protein
METFCSILSPLSLGRCDKTPQELGELIGNSFFQDVDIVATKGIADPNQSVSSEFFCLISL